MATRNYLPHCHLFFVTGQFGFRRSRLEDVRDARSAYEPPGFKRVEALLRAFFGYFLFMQKKVAPS